MPIATHSDVPHEHEHDVDHNDNRRRTGGWMPADHNLHREFLAQKIAHVDKHPQTLSPVLQEFKELIEGNTRIYMYFTAMFDEVPQKKPYKKDPTGNKQIRDYKHMLQVLNHILTTAPSWTSSAEKVGMVGVPMNAVFDWPMGTPSGNAAFLDPDVNRMLKKVLNEWGKYLKSPESASVLHKDKHGWFGETAVKDIQTVANKASKTNLVFEQMFKCDPSHETYGFKSWDDFFTRELQDGYRPVAAPDDDSIIANACESKPFGLQRNCSMRSKFWNKGQPYSIRDMLGHDPLAEEFDGATVYQAFLSALSYHRWHTPVSGTIKRAFVVDGTYFSEPLWEGLGDPSEKHEIEKAGITSGQAYISNLAARAIIFIEPDNADLGKLVAFIGIGMDEVSTCELIVKEGQHVKKGEETGRFHFGGSTHCLLFQKDVQVGGFPEAGGEANIPVRSELAAVKPRK